MNSMTRSKRREKDDEEGEVEEEGRERSELRWWGPFYRAPRHFLPPKHQCCHRQRQDTPFSSIARRFATRRLFAVGYASLTALEQLRSVAASSFKPSPAIVRRHQEQPHSRTDSSRSELPSFLSLFLDSGLFSRSSPPSERLEWDQPL